MNTTPDRLPPVVRLLTELRALLVSQNENNWRRGIEAALAEITAPDGTMHPSGFDNARSIYKTMTAGGGGFAEYSVWSQEEAERRRANQRLHALRAQLWQAFDL